MFKLSTFNWFKVLSPVALAASIFLAAETPVDAIPHISVSGSRDSSGYSYRNRTISAPPSLNITPPAGRHISLPRSSRSRYYRRSRDRYYSREDCRDGYRRKRRYSHRRRRRYSHHRRGHGRIIIVNPVLRY